MAAISDWISASVFSGISAGTFSEDGVEFSWSVGCVDLEVAVVLEDLEDLDLGLANIWT
jgi:hypothetical protein